LRRAAAFAADKERAVRALFLARFAPVGAKRLLSRFQGRMKTFAPMTAPGALDPPRRLRHNGRDGDNMGTA
jgi:hypothetical protein